MVSKSDFVISKYKSLISYLKQKEASLSPESKAKLLQLENEAVTNIILFFKHYVSKHSGNLKPYIISWLDEYKIPFTDDELIKIQSYFECLLEITS